VPLGPDTPGRLSPSVGSASVPPPNRRGKNAAKKEGLSESLEPDGHLPGFKDGVGVFPPGSDWAEVMLALKLKGKFPFSRFPLAPNILPGKRYRSKKERLRMEKGGPPYTADGSLDYTESEFQSSHRLTYTDLGDAVEDPFSVLSAIVPDPPFSPLLTPLIHDPSQINPPLPTGAPSPKDPSSAAESLVGGTRSKYRHWTITRPAPQRAKAKEAAEEGPSPLDSKKPRPLHTADFGLFPSIAAQLSLSSGAATGSEEELLAALRTSLESAARSEHSADDAAIAQSWLREVVYGGFDGLAYMRSVAEFVTPPHGVPPATGDHNPDLPNTALTEYIDTVLIDEITERRHRTIETAVTHPEVPGLISHATAIPEPPIVPATPLDLGSLISAPNELFDAEKTWVAAGMKEDSAVLSRALEHAAHLLEELHTRRAGPGATDENTAKERDLETELRMNLIALAKRAPLDQIAKIPQELVPPHLRDLIPTIGT
jgi:bromodomain-containing protein 7/9